MEALPEWSGQDSIEPWALVAAEVEAEAPREGALRGRWPLFSESRDAFSPSSLHGFPLIAEQSKTDLLPRVLSFPCPLGLWVCGL